AVLSEGRKEIEELIENYLVEVRGRRPEDKFSKGLFAVLLQPFISEGSNAKIIVIPDGKLNLLPFDALKDQHGRYVLESHVVTYAPSASVLHLWRNSEHRNHAPTSFLGVGDAIHSVSAILKDP